MENGRQLAQLALDDKGKATSVVSLPAGRSRPARRLRGRRGTSGFDLRHQQRDRPGQLDAEFCNFPGGRCAFHSAAHRVTWRFRARRRHHHTPGQRCSHAPMFVTLSCSGLPALASCAFTPESIEILPTTPASCPSGSPAIGLPAGQLHADSDAASGTHRKVNACAAWTSRTAPLHGPFCCRACWGLAVLPGELDAHAG